MGLCEPPAPCSGFCFFLLPSGMLLQLCLQLGRCHLTGPTGPRSWSAVFPFSIRSRTHSQKGRLETQRREYRSPISENSAFLLWGKKLHTLSTAVKDQKAPLALDRALHSWSWSREQQSWQAVLGSPSGQESIRMAWRPTDH